MPSNVRDKIIYPFPFNRYAAEILKLYIVDVITFYAGTKVNPF